MLGERLRSLLGMLAFAATLAAGIALAWGCARYLALEGAARDRFVLVGCALALIPGAMVLLWAMRWTRAAADRTRDDALAADRAQAAATRAAALDALRVALRADPDLARYADEVGVDGRAWVPNIEHARAREARVRELLRRPGGERYAARIRAGEVIPDALIDYWEHPSRPLLCTHLRVLEADIRAADPRLTVHAPGAIAVNLSLRFEALRARYALPEHVCFEQEALTGGRADDYYTGRQTLACAACACSIQGSEFFPPFPAA